MPICYQYESAFFPAPYAENRCFAAEMGRRMIMPLTLRASNTTTRFSSRSSNFSQFHPKDTPETISRGQKSKISWGSMPPDPPSRHTLQALLEYWNPPLQNSRPATDSTQETLLYSFQCCSREVLLSESFFVVMWLILCYGEEPLNSRSNGPTNRWRRCWENS